MRVIAVIQADLDVTPLGTRSRLAEDVSGKTILRHTVEHVCRASGIETVYVLCPVNQAERCKAMLRETDAIVRPFDAPPAPWSELVQTARKWSLDGWRGGLGGAMYFDEFMDTRLLVGLLEDHKADAVLCLPSAAPLIDTGLIERMIEHQIATQEETRLTFTQAPPGIAGLLLDVRVIHQLAEQNLPVGWLFGYRPDDPQKDLVFHPCCLEIPTDLRHAVGRLAADTDRSTERIAALMEEHANASLATIGQWLDRREHTTIEPLPREVEIELTTEDPYPHAMLRPAGSRVEQRGPIDPVVVDRVVAEVARYDDALIVLGGFGDPLRHPRFREILESIQSARANGHGPYGLAIRTRGVDLTDENIEAIINNDADVVNVTLDAWTPQLYARLQSPDDPAAADLDAVLKRLDRLVELRQQRETVKPVIVPEMTKARENVHELDEFYDGWVRRNGAVTISGYCHFAGQCEDHSVIRMAPPTRIGCRRLRSRCMVLADGRVAVCDQDFNGQHTVGLIGEQSLEELWLGETFTRIREAHRQGQFDPTPLCAACEEWHRP